MSSKQASVQPAPKAPTQVQAMDVRATLWSERKARYLQGKTKVKLLN
jgi:hypothetical protein